MHIHSWSQSCSPLTGLNIHFFSRLWASVIIFQIPFPSRILILCDFAEMGAFRRLRDMGYALFFLAHLAMIILFDAQLVMDKKLFAKQLIDFKNQYVKDYKDPLVGNNPTWFQSFVWLEIFAYVPFLFFGFFGALAGARWMRIPSIMYATSLITTAIPMLAHILHDNFPAPKVGPKTPDDRMYLTALYGSFIAVATWMLLDNWWFRSSGFSTHKIEGPKSTTTYVGGKQKKN
ncbi:hypothetical protein RvY_14437 [Ramazzottius varieornatus]|uniref:EXPERA domain-containing protein n=1 Tax=Ramazzottius varieornatus TaxID=947166 RepID=A0A1D1VZR9_RAMVA|nr:hypothetical protein RvY_14437 [Ramazzottius varieornatus]